MVTAAIAEKAVAETKYNIITCLSKDRLRLVAEMHYHLSHLGEDQNLPDGCAWKVRGSITENEHSSVTPLGYIGRVTYLTYVLEGTDVPYYGLIVIPPQEKI